MRSIARGGLASPAGAKAAPQGYLFLPARWRRADILLWLRRTHAWCGFWGAALALLFGVTGIVLNHRATLKIPGARMQQTTIQVRLPGAPPPDAPALAASLQRLLALDKPALQVKAEPAQDVVWNGVVVRQPALFRVWFASPRRSYLAEYWAGNGYATVKQQDPDFLVFLTRLHMGTGASLVWILLVDALAGGLIALALTGLLLWSRLHGPRLLALALAGGSVTAAWAAVWHSL